MPWRIASSASTLTEKKRSTPHACSICTAALEKPHCGNCGVPFMYSTTGCVVTCSRIVSWVVMAVSLCLVVRILAELRAEGRDLTHSPPWIYSFTAPGTPETEYSTKNVDNAATGTVPHSATARNAPQ